MLGDQALYNANGEITTKEILKRFGERSAYGSQPQLGDIGRNENASRPPPRRIETDPSAWQSETSVRAVQDPMVPSYANPSQATPPSKRRNPDDGGNGSPHVPSHFDGSTDALERGGQPAPGPGRREWRNSGWNTPNGGNPPPGNI